MKLSQDNDSVVFETIHESVKEGKVAVIVMHDHDSEITEGESNCLLFAYTVGLTCKGFPELFIFYPNDGRGVAYGQLLGSMVNHICTTNTGFEDGWKDLNAEFASQPMMVKDLTPAQVREWTVPANEYLEAQKHQWPRFQQIVVPDREGRNIDDPNYDHAYMGEVWGQKLLFETKPVLQ